MEQLKKCTCKVCGKEFEYSRVKYICSEECIKAQARKKYHEKKPKLKAKQCVICQKEFFDPHSRHTTCSVECKKILHKQTAKKCKMRSKLIEMGIDFTEDKIEELYYSIVVKPTREKIISDKKREKKELERYLAAEKKHRAFRASIKKETIAADEKEARKLGISYGYYIANVKGK